MRWRCISKRGVRQGFQGKIENSNRGDKQEKKVAYMEIFWNIEERRVRYSCHLDFVVEREVKCITTLSISKQVNINSI